MPYAGPLTAGTKSALPAFPRHHSISMAIRSDRPASAARPTIVAAKDRWQAGCGSPTCVSRSTGAQAHPGWAARTTIRSRSGNSRRSPSGLPSSDVLAAESSERNVSKTGDIPTPSSVALASRPIGIAFTRSTPAVAT